MSDGAALSGVFPVLVTPFQADGSIGIPDFDRVIAFNLAAGVDGLVFPGNASEVGALRADERRVLTGRLFDQVGGRVPVVVGLSADNADTALALAAHARQMKAAAAMISPPVALRNDLAGIRSLLIALGEAASVPLILQNAPPPLGPGLAPEAVVELVRTVPAIEYVKEECLPAGQRISQCLASAPPGLRGVFGGAAGRFIMDEYARGACGTMPSCEIPDEHLALTRAFRAGDIVLARSIYNRIVPLLQFTSVFKAAGVKAALVRRGIIDSDRHRDLGPSLDAMDRRELAAILAGVLGLPEPEVEAAPLASTQSRRVAR